jgi:hypothetical protein
MSVRERNLDRQRRYAWAQYYTEVNRDHENIVAYYTIVRNVGDHLLQNPTLPQHLLTEIEEMATAMRKQYECPICLEMIPSGQLDITNCGHKYCKTCLTTLLTQTAPSCAMCRKELKRREG